MRFQFQQKEEKVMTENNVNENVERFGPKLAAVIERVPTLTPHDTHRLTVEWLKKPRHFVAWHRMTHSGSDDVAAATQAVHQTATQNGVKVTTAMLAVAGALAIQDQISDQEFRSLSDTWKKVVGEPLTPPVTDDSDWVNLFNKRH